MSFIIFQVILKLVFLSFNSQMYLPNSVRFIFVLLLKVDLWLSHVGLGLVSIFGYNCSLVYDVVCEAFAI